jgi:hypothetical protein
LSEAVAFSTWLCLHHVSKVAAPALYRLRRLSFWQLGLHGRIILDRGQPEPCYWRADLCGFLLFRCLCGSKRIATAVYLSLALPACVKLLRALIVSVINALSEIG